MLVAQTGAPLSANPAPPASFSASIRASVIELFLPARCALCAAHLPAGDGEGGVCGVCWRGMPALGEKRCTRCDLPLPGVAPQSLCLSCGRELPAFSGLAAWGPYTGALREALHRFKFAGADALARPFAARLTARLSETRWAPALVAAVPMRLWRRHRRGYNPAQLLAEEVARLLGLPLARGVLRRRRSPIQATLGRAERWRAASRAYATLPWAHRRLAGREVLLVDDVATTGATAHACAAALRSAGAAGVVVCAVARTPENGA